MALKYAELKRDLIEDSAVTTIYGVPVEFDADDGRIGGELSIGLTDGKFIPIWGFCFCVQDSPDNPCRCHGPIIWLPKDKIFKAGKTGRKDTGSNEIFWFRLDQNTKIVVDAQIPSTAGLYEQALREFGGKLATPIANVPPPGPQPLHPITLAFYGFMVLNALGVFDGPPSWKVDLCKKHPDHPICKE